MSYDRQVATQKEAYEMACSIERVYGATEITALAKAAAFDIQSAATLITKFSDKVHSELVDLLDAIWF